MSARDASDTGRRLRDLNAELADAIERVWMTRWGSVPIVAQVVIARLRRGDA